MNKDEVTKETDAEAESTARKPDGNDVAEEPEGEAAKGESEAEQTEESGSDSPAQDEDEEKEAVAEQQDSPTAEPDWKDMYVRALADFDNYRKRTSRDREELVKFATSEAIRDMLPTADNLALALDRAKDKDDPFVKGVQLAYEGLLKALKDHGAEPFESIGETLDPNRHEAIATLPSEAVEEGKISNEVKKGWMLNGRLLRAAQVVVSSGKAK